VRIPAGPAHLAAIVLLLAPLASARGAEPPAPGPAAAALEQLRAANQARGEEARELAAWTLERQRLEALVDATRAETARLEREADQADAARDAARTRLAALGAGSDLEALRARLAEAAARVGADLTALAARMPPGVVPAVADAADGDAFDAAVRALEGAERAASAVAVDVVTGTRDGRTDAPEAVKVLRVAGAAAWWVSLDGAAAGTLSVRAGAVTLHAVADDAARAAIIAALAQAEGRAQPSIALLVAPPGDAP